MNSEDLRNLADAYSDLANALVDWRAENPITDAALGTQFDDLVADLVEKSDSLGNMALTAALTNLQTSVAGLQGATQKARHALSVINDVTKALAIGAAAVRVVASLLAPAVTAVAVAGALSGLEQALRTATGG